MNNRAGSSPASEVKRSAKRTLMQIFYCLPSKTALKKKTLSKNRPSAAWFFSVYCCYFLFISKHLLILRCSIQCSEVVLRGFCAADDSKLPSSLTELCRFCIFRCSCIPWKIHVRRCRDEEGLRLPLPKHAVDREFIVVLAQRACYVIFVSHRLIFFSHHRDDGSAVHSRSHQVDRRHHSRCTLCRCVSDGWRG